MSSGGTTSIDQLPVNPQSTNNSQPVQPMQNSNNQNPNQNPNQNSNSQNVKIENYGQQLNAERPGNIPPIDYTSQLTSALKTASEAGVTVLPSRDIPRNTLPRQQDENIKPNFVPKKQNEDYIGDILNKERIIQENNRKQNQSDNIDYIYQQIQLPIIVGILYFIFQLPIFRKYLLSFLPSLFNKDGNPNLPGYIFNSVAFASLYSLLIKSTDYLSG